MQTAELIQVAFQVRQAVVFTAVHHPGGGREVPQLVMQDKTPGDKMIDAKIIRAEGPAGIDIQHRANLNDIFPKGAGRFKFSFAGRFQFKRNRRDTGVSFLKEMDQLIIVPAGDDDLVAVDIAEPVFIHHDALFLAVNPVEGGVRGLGQFFDFAVFPVVFDAFDLLEER